MTEANNLLSTLEDEIQAIYTVLRQRYAPRFSELESLGMTALEYARCVLLIGDAWDLARIDLKSAIPPATAIVVTLAASTTAGRRLTPDELGSVLDLARLIVTASEHKDALLRFVEQQMLRVAPNVVAIVGIRIAGQLVGVAGSIQALSRIPANNLKVMGGGRKASVSGYAKQDPHSGFIWQSDLVQSTDAEHREKAQRLISAKVALAARIDAQQADGEGRRGRAFRVEIIEKLEKAAEPVPLNEPRAIAPPDAKPRRKRGGKRYRRLKELTSMTEARRAANRIAFGEAESEVIVGESVRGLGMLGRSARPVPMDGKLRERLKRHAETHAQSATKASSARGAFDNPFRKQQQ